MSDKMADEARAQSPPSAASDVDGTAWIDELSDEQCMEIFWLYVDPPEEFLSSHPPRLLGQAMRHALRLVVRDTRDDLRAR